MELRYITSGESHGRAITGTIEGIPAGLELSADDINPELKRRQGGYGRGGRMKIESDTAQLLTGVRWGRTLGSPITLLIENRDWTNWEQGMSPGAEGEGSIPPVTRPRPGHADLAGALKYDHDDIRNVLERSSARETASRVALGAVAKKFLMSFGVRVGSYVTSIGGVDMGIDTPASESELTALFDKAETSETRCPDASATQKMKDRIDEAVRDGDSLGGVFEVFATGVPIGLGSYVQWDRKLDGRLAQAVMSVQAIKAVEIGLGMRMGHEGGSGVMDEIGYSGGRFVRSSNNAGGIEGGMSNGMPIVLRAVMKPIPTLRRPLASIDMRSKETVEAAYERSDVCAVPAAAVVCEAMTALVLAGAFLEKFGGDGIEETLRNYRAYLTYIREA